MITVGLQKLQKIIGKFPVASGKLPVKEIKFPVKRSMQWRIFYSQKIGASNRADHE
jgi:hypothetical protein